MNYTLHLGDCLEYMKTMEDQSVDVVITDPPYGVGLSAKRARQRAGGVSVREGSYDFDDTPEYIKSVVIPAIAECRRVARAVAITPGTRNLWLYPPADDVGVFYSAAGTGMGKWGFTCSQPILYYGSDPYLANSLGARPNSCGQTYPNDANKIDHPCAKPIRMMEWLVNRASLEGMTVFDPFMGSGTTGVACLKLQRHFIGCEINPKYFATAKKRLEQASLQKHLFTASHLGCMGTATPQGKQPELFTNSLGSDGANSNAVP